MNCSEILNDTNKALFQEIQNKYVGIFSSTSDDHLGLCLSNGLSAKYLDTVNKDLKELSSM